MSAPGGKWGGRGAAGWLWIFCLVSAGWGAPSVAVGAEPEPKEVLVSMSTQRWLYNDAGTDLGSTWHATVFPAETQWRSGLGLFGVESSFPYPYPLPLATPLVLNAGRTTYYFRTRFHFSGDTTNLLLRATSYIDDGAVFYLNGNEVDRVRLPQGAITFSTKADLAFPEGGAVLTQIPVNRLLQGDNVLAVEVHQNSDTSSDVVFGLKLETFSLVVPVILNPAEPSDRTVPEGERKLKISVSP